jgi:type I restriction enzyme R subunit
MADVSELRFEESIEASLLAGGPDAPAAIEGVVAEPIPEYGTYVPGRYRKRSWKDYDRALCLDPQMLVAFVQGTQPKRWARLTERYGEVTADRFTRRVMSEVEKRGLLDVLRKGVKDSGVQVDLAYFRPSTGLNPEVQTLYEGNIFSVVRQLRYSDRTEDSIDMVLFLNGLPIFTAELKNPLNRQDVRDAIKQYREDRDPREPLLSFGRCVAHFVVDPELVYVTTLLEGRKTTFLPFNRGRYGGAGNPPDPFGFPTRYLWEHVWSRDSVLELVQRFVHLVFEEDDKGRKTGKKWLIFPRYHQLDAVRRLVADAERKGPGQRYLIQHSAGSGKSNTIAWLAHQLSVLHGATDERIFDSIVVITDRKVLDRQLQRTVRQFEQTLGVVENIDKTSRQLKDALEAGKTIIVTTLQKFPQIVEQIGAFAQKRFAVLIDEAHSSQSGRATLSMKKVLKASSLEEAEAEDAGGEDLEDLVVAEARARGPLPNLSLFAFTATPKQKTLELFGTRSEDGKPKAFSLYSMRQAIDEGFIMDVLENYTTYRMYWSLLKKVEDDPKFDREKAAYLLKRFVDLNDHAVDRKVEIMVEHFHANVAHRIDGRAKAMIVTRSRLHAVRTKLALDRYLKGRAYQYRALVAFSGEVHDGPKTYSEPNMNGFGERQTATVFKQADYRFLVVAEKFQTGFDEPLLHTMYVDKRLRGVNAVQTLSRLNRVHAAKEETMVLDFANEAEDIRKGFEPYYEATILSEETDPNVLYDVQRRLLDAEIFDEGDVQRFAEAYFGQQDMAHLYEVLDAVVERYKERDADEQGTFKHELGRFTRLYAFLAQIMPFEDADLEKLYWFAYWLDRRLESPKETLPVEVQKFIDIESLRIQETSSGRIEIERGEGELRPIVGGVDIPIQEEELESLSQIIRELNERFGTDFREEDRVFVEELLDRLGTDAALEASVRANTPENARLTFDHVVSDRLQDMVETNFEFYKRVNDDARFSRFFLDRLFEMYRKRVEDTPSGPKLSPVIKSAIEILARELKPKKIILFGSAARDEMNEESDIDLLVVKDQFASRFREISRASRLLAQQKIPADVLVYSSSEVEQWGDVPNHVINEALLDGRVVYEAA